VRRFTSPGYVCERCRFGIPEKLAYGDPKGRNGRLFVPTADEQLKKDFRMEGFGIKREEWYSLSANQKGDRWGSNPRPSEPQSR
jgi:hypothetical protein